MKRKILFTLFGGIIIFIWEFLSFAMPNFHKSETRYTPLQDSILMNFEKLGLQEGTYVLGQADPELRMTDQEKVMEKYANKPWAVVSYHSHMSMEMAMPMIRGLLVCFVISFLLFWMMLQQKNTQVVHRVLLAVAVGMIGFFFHPYTHHIWYQEPGIFAYFADGIVPWLLLGLLGYWLAKPKMPAQG